jgi:hypothetical protein
MQPKAKWTKPSGSEVWSAFVGPFYLEVNPPACSLREVSTLAVLWEHVGPVPCDAPDLMRLTETELARRLEDAAETMDGRDLVARGADETGTGTLVFADKPIYVDAQRHHDELTAWGDAKWGASPQFKVGDLVRTQHGVAVVTEVFTEATAFASDGCDGRLRNEEITPYTLPPIRSYSELATALDELPDGWRIARTICRKPEMHRDCIECLEPYKYTEWSTHSSIDLTEEYPEDCSHRVRPPAVRPRQLAQRPNHLDLVRCKTTCLVGWVEFVDSDGFCHLRFDNIHRPVGYWPDELLPYTLPPINSYADLADVLDELPEGWRVKMVAEDGWFVYRRADDRYESKNDMSAMGFTRPAFVSVCSNVGHAAFSVLPPERGN